MIDTTAIKAFLTPEHIAFAEKLAGFCEAEIEPLPIATDDDAARAQARPIVQALGKADLLKSLAPLDLRSACMIREALGAANTLADELFALQALAITPMELGGPCEAKDTWLPKLRSGEAIGAFAMTEPEAGSDVANLQTTARREGEAWVLNGHKTLISNAGVADVYCVFAQTDPGSGHKGVGCFAVPADTPGFVFHKAQVLTAPHPLGELRFEDCRVPDSARLDTDGRGFALGMGTLDRVRTTVAAAACGMATRALAEALAHCKARRQFGKPIAEFQLVQHKLAAMALDLDAARLLTYRSAWVKDSGAARVTTESAMAKAFATEAAQRIIDSAVQLFGGKGVLAEAITDRLYRAIRALRIYEGTTEIQHLVIAGQLLKG